VAENQLIVVALGGNAMQDPEGEDTVEADFRRTAETADRLVALIVGGYRVVVTHGNGPQVGNHLLRSELANRHGDLPLLPLDVCVADTQGGMGYVLQQSLVNALGERGIPGVVAAVVTQVLVDDDDPAFENPSKPVGEMISPDRADALRAQGWSLVEDTHRRGFRRVVPSPDPKEIVEAQAIRAMVEDGTVVIAGGGGGIPVAQAPGGSLRGVPAVVDKDLAAALLAIDLGARSLLILTDVDSVRLGYDTPEERAVDRMTVPEARSYLHAGEFPSGSMGPKVEAVCRFVEATGNRASITSIALAEKGLRGEAGTHVVPFM
jgi:carbamate kinase